MQTTKTIQKTGNQVLLALALCLSVPAHAAPAVEFQASVDRTQVSLDDNVSLKLRVRTEGASGGPSGPPTFNAPDFEVVNEYAGTFVESYYDNGRVGMHQTMDYTKVLKPLKKGTLKISGIQVQGSDGTYKSPDITVIVSGASPGTPPPLGYGSAPGNGLRGNVQRPSPGGSTHVFVRGEVDKNHAYKGEQIIVSYYIYQQVRVFNLQIDKFPILKGFLREDLEMPVLGARLEPEQVVLNGEVYQRALLVRYAAYPLEEGKLYIDPIGLKYNYYSGSQRGRGDQDDPFMNFFQQLSPLSGTAQSAVVPIEVAPLPLDGRPQSFSGGVGDFNVIAASDKTELHANEALNLTLKIEGRGNVASISEPKAPWPDNVELYDSKGHSKSGKGGVGEKTFEFLLIPRAPGQLTLPAIEVSFFDPVKKEYYTKHTDPITVHVLDPLPGSAAPVARAKQADSTASPAPSGDALTGPENELRPLKADQDQEARPGFRGLPIWRWLYWFCGAAFIVFILWVANDAIRRRKKKFERENADRARGKSKSWDHLRNLAKMSASAPWEQIHEGYESLAGAVFDALDRKYDVGARGLARSDLKNILVDERGMKAETWAKVSLILEHTEMVRFASAAGAVSQDRARTDFGKWVSEGEASVKAVENGA